MRRAEYAASVKTRIAQITDLHVARPGQLLFGVLDTPRLAAQAVAHVRALDPAPDVVLVTGDLVASGLAAEYAHVREILDGLDRPYYVIPGNHDRRSGLLAAFDGHAAADGDGHIQYTVEDLPVRLVALDTLREEHDDGLFDEVRAAWLRDTLAHRPDTPTLVFMHHPPFETGVWWMDTAGLAGAGMLRDIVAHHPQVRLVVCGHVHRPVTTSWAGTVVTIAPGVAFQVALDLVPESRPKAAPDPPAVLLHMFDGESFVTHTSYVGTGPALDLSDFMSDWERLKVEWRERKAAIDASSA